MKKALRRFLPKHEAIRENRWLKPFSSTLLHPRLWYLNRHSAAGAVAVGLFCGLIPGPLQMLGAAILCVVLRVNLPLSLIITLYTNPLTIVPLYLIAFGLGGWILGDVRTAFIAPPEMVGMDLAGWAGGLIQWMAGLGKPLALGLVLLAAGLSLSGYLAVRAAWRVWLIRQWRRRALSRNQLPPTS
ncbi:MAG: DUF2062 domain-containing protein [Azoarcus sp.]|nr:DUF2062 domain-containing protein [Azoarcus sp.]